jgi:apolipoprotein N-acyltransferase
VITIGRAPRSFLAPAISGLLLAFAYFAPGVWADAIFLLPLLWWLDETAHQDPLRTRWGGFVFGFVGYTLALHFHTAMADHSWLAYPLWLGFAFAEAIKTTLIVLLASKIRRRLHLPWTWTLPPLWLTAEWTTEHLGDLRMTADHLANGLANQPFRVQFIEWTGPYGAGALVLLVNTLLYESIWALWAHRRRRSMAALLLLVTAVLIADGWLWKRATAVHETAPTVRIAAVQPNIPLAEKHDSASAAEQWSKLLEGTVRAVDAGATVVIWPESARPFLMHELGNRIETRRMAEVEALAGRLGISIVVGVEFARYPSEDVYELYNAAFLVHADGTLDEAWGGKVYLVPFAEGLPFKALLGPLVEGRGGEWGWIAGGFSSAPRSALLPVLDDEGGELSIGVLVCYEEFFASLSRRLRNEGADIQTVITNDAWFGHTLLQGYLRDAVRLRAIENRTSFVRAANTGISGVVDSLGRYEQVTPLFEEALVIADVTRAQGRTVYNVYGDIVAWLALAISGLLVLLYLVRAKR